MALDMNIDFKNINLKFLQNLPKPARISIAVVPAVIVLALFIFLSIMPKRDEVKKLETEIAAQEAEIAKSQSMVARLDELKAENERLKKLLMELQENLPEEGEISSLLKQVSDLGLDSGLSILSWKPANRRTHPSGIVYEVPVDVSLNGSYHRLGKFFSSLTGLERIVNITDIKMGSPKMDVETVVLKVNFKAVTFTAVSQEGMLK